MNNFLDFILKDTEAKRTLISTMPTKTKTNKKKLNETLDVMHDKYEEYRSSVRNYLIAKAKTLDLRPIDNSAQIDEINTKIETLGNVKFLLNPDNTYFEKMGFDNLLYQISNYFVFNFKSLNTILNGFLDKFELAGVILTPEDFNYTCYVNEYMTSYLEVRTSKSDKYDKVNEIFEKIYWVNPQIVEHIELNLRRLIRKHERKFESYVKLMQSKVMAANNVKTYGEVLQKLDEAYNELTAAQEETVTDIIALAKSGEIDINNYQENSKQLASAYSLFFPENIDKTDLEKMNKLMKYLKKMLLNIKEYKGYLEYLPLFEDFKNRYLKMLPQDGKKGEKSEKEKNAKSILNEIKSRESELDSINRKITGGRFSFFATKDAFKLKNLRMESVNVAKDIYTLYRSYDDEYIDKRVATILNKHITVTDVLHLFYSYDYFKKIAIKRVYDIKEYSEIIKYSDNFDLFSMDSTNIIVDGIEIFGSSDIPNFIANKYRLNGIKVDASDLSEDNLDTLIEQINMVLRDIIIKNSETDARKIWFIVQLDKILAKEEKEAKEKEEE